MLNTKTLLTELKRLVTDLAEDLLARSTAKDDPYSVTVDSGLREAFTQIEKGGRTSDAFEVWREDYLDQVAVAWVLGCVFVRFMEDNQLIDECWLAGEGERRKLAEDTHELYFRAHPHDSDREYFEHVFHEVGKIPACRDLFAEGKTPLWAVGPSGDMAMRLLGFWRDLHAEKGHLKRSFQVEDGDTRFLGDLYQDLSERARKKYALLQTPVFVEEFILDRTLEPAIEEFGLETVRMIDPTCGSGHFLLGGFARLFDRWIRREDNEIAAAQKALDGVWGCDINPFAVAIARFRLIVAALRACGIGRLKGAPRWKIHLATGDSLLFGQRWDREGTAKGAQLFLTTEEEGSWAPEIYACEDQEAIAEVLGQQYHAVVGNPPYITPKDKSLNQAYRDRYATCHQKYSLAVPFMERFFDLAVAGGRTTNHTKDTHGERAGYVGQITANSFMKREFGKKLIEQFFAKVDLTHVIDTSGAYIPGHGTPTVILFGRNRAPLSDTVRAVLGIKGEPSTPPDPSQGLVWQSIVRHVDQASAQDAFTSTGDVPRATFTSHPWSIGGGGASDLKDQIELFAKLRLGGLTESIGISSVTGEDDLFVFDRPLDPLRLRTHRTKNLVLGDMIRDHVVSQVVHALWPYDDKFGLLKEFECSDLIRVLWPYKTSISQRRRFGTPMLLKGAKWYEWQEIYYKKLRSPFSIAFAFVATHNHFVLDRGGKVFNRSAPIIKFPPDATEDDHLALLGLLNSSTACFWMKQVFFPKGGDHVGQEGARVRRTWWDERYEFAGTQLQSFPVPNSCPLQRSAAIDQIAKQYSSLLPEFWITTTVRPTSERLVKSWQGAMNLRDQMISLQEELDWECYRLYGLTDEVLTRETQRHEGETGEPTSSGPAGALCSPPPLRLGERAFEIVMARQMAAGELETTWFERHGSTPITEIPSDWPKDYRQLVERRIEWIETNPAIGLIERPEYKRRWNTESWEDQQQRALKNWLLERLESSRYWPNPAQHEPRLQSVAELSDKASGDHDFLQVAALYRGREDFDVPALVAELVEAEAVPFLPVLRYKPTGLRRREVWEQVWDLQRTEDRFAQQRAECDRRLQQVKLRIKAIHAAEEGKLEWVEAKLRERCLALRNTYATRVKLSESWDSSMMIGVILATGVHQDGADEALELNRICKGVENLRRQFNEKQSDQLVSDEEYISLQREREEIPGAPNIPVPPKYTSADFLKTDFWRLRGKLDVPKERWISYPHCETESDPSLVVGWAGWNHLQQAAALIAYYDARKRDGWDAKRLTPLLAGLDQLLPWIHQWHPEVDPEFGETAGQSFETMLKADAHELGLTLENIRAWQPPPKKKGGRGKAKK